MKIWSTNMQVVNQVTKKLHWVEGMKVVAPTRDLAQQILDAKYFNYLVLGDEIVAEIPCKEGSFEADFDNMIDYDVIRGN